MSACAVVAIEAGLALVGARSPAFSVAALVLAPGLALIPLLPARARQSWTAVVAAAPAVGVAASASALITMASVGIHLTGLSIRLCLAALALVGVVGLRGSEPRIGRGEALAALGLAGAVAVGLVLQNRVIGGSPVPGNDWGKYLLYADEIRRQGSLLIDNPYWLLGVPFREDPGASSLYGAYLILSGQPAAQLVHGIWAFAIIFVLTTYAFVRSWWGPVAAVLAALLCAVVPANQDILGWHGLANTAAIALMPLVLMYLTELVMDGLDLRAAAGFATVLVGIAAVHKLSFGVAGVIVGVTLVLAFAGGGRRRLVEGALATAVFVLLFGAGVAYDLITRGRTFGGVPNYTAYLGAKVDLGLTAGDLTWVFAIAALVAAVLGVVWAFRDRRFLPLIAVLPGAAFVGYGWLLHLGGHYFRMVYFLPIAAVPLVAIALVRLLRPWQAALAGVALAAVVAGFAWGQAGNVRDFYSYLNPTSAQALDRLAGDLHPNEIVVTDRCWSFLATWLLHTRTLAAVEPEDVLPRAELPLTRKGRLVLAGAPEGIAYARRLGIRYALVDPTCADFRGRAVRVSAAGQPVFVSKRLAVLRLSHRARLADR